MTTPVLNTEQALELLEERAEQLQEVALLHAVAVVALALRGGHCPRCPGDGNNPMSPGPCPGLVPPKKR